MLTLQIEKTDGALSIGPVPYLKIERDELKSGPDDAVIATHKGRQWEYRGSSFTVLTVPVGCCVTFQGGPTHGPFKQLRIVDGFVRGGDGWPLAGYNDATSLWFAYPDGKHYYTLIIAAADAPPRHSSIQRDAAVPAHV